MPCMYFLPAPYRKHGTFFCHECLTDVLFLIIFFLWEKIQLTLQIVLYYRGILFHLQMTPLLLRKNEATYDAANERALQGLTAMLQLHAGFFGSHSGTRPAEENEPLDGAANTSEEDEYLGDSDDEIVSKELKSALMSDAFCTDFFGTDLDCDDPFPGTRIITEILEDKNLTFEGLLDALDSRNNSESQARHFRARRAQIDFFLNRK